MIIVRTEIYTVPNTDDGRYVAQQYEDDMKNAGMGVSREETTKSLTLVGRFVGDLPDEIIMQMRNPSKEIT